MSLRLTVTVAVLTPSATTVVGLAATVELAADVGAAVGADPSPGLAPSSLPSGLGCTLRMAEKRCGVVKAAPPAVAGFSEKMPTTHTLGVTSHLPVMVGVP